MTSSPPRRKGLGGVTLGILIGLGVSVVLAVCGIPAYGFYIWAFEGPDLGGATAVAERYLQRVEAGDDAGAYDLICAGARDDVTLADFTALVDEGPRPTGHDVTRSVFRTEAGYDATVSVRLTGPGGTVRDLQLDLREEPKGPWQVCGNLLI